MDLTQFILALRARRKAFFIALAATIVTAVAVALIVPKKYVATATLLMDPRDEQTMSPGRLWSGRDRANYLQTQVDLLTSNRVAIQVARDLKLGARPKVREAWEKDTGGAGQIDEWIGAQLLEKVEVDPSAGNVILVNYASEDPRYAADVANAFAKAYLEISLHLRTATTREAADWFDQQLKTLRTQVTQAQGKLNSYQRDKGVLAADGSTDVEAAQLTALSTQLLTARNATYDAATRHKAALAILENGGSAEAIPEVLANAHIVSLKSELGRVEARKEQESAVYGPNHPQYLRTEAEAQVLRARVQAEMKKLVTVLGNQVQQHRQRERELEGALDAQNKRLIHLKDYRVEMAAMTRDIDNAQRSYDTVLTRYMTNKIDSAAKQTNVTLLTAAIEPLKPVHPKVGLITGLSVVLGLLLAAGIVYVLETLDRRVRSRADLEARLAVPSLGLLSKWQPTSSRLLPAPIKASRALPYAS
jgi:chain length determinant protein EpsF